MFLISILRHGFWTCFNKNLIHTKSLGHVIYSVIHQRARVYQVTADLFIFFFLAGNHWETTHHYLSTKIPNEIMKLLAVLMCLKERSLSLIYLKCTFKIFVMLCFTHYILLYLVYHSLHNNFYVFQNLWSNTLCFIGYTTPGQTPRHVIQPCCYGLKCLAQ